MLDVGTVRAPAGVAARAGTCAPAPAAAASAPRRWAVPFTLFAGSAYCACACATRALAGRGAADPVARDHSAPIGLVAVLDADAVARAAAAAACKSCGGKVTASLACQLALQHSLPSGKRCVRFPTNARTCSLRAVKRKQQPRTDVHAATHTLPAPSPPTCWIQGTPPHGPPRSLPSPCLACSQICPPPALALLALLAPVPALLSHLAWPAHTCGHSASGA
mmetsp:Transcript_16495/g.49119  ORF Transcript_16495/g.49119 Transcript_16495/m.49119 type:complete len:221 (-) Transcript_16495:549-1211(-)